MTENEKLQHAKSYMEELAAGINPLDGTELPEDDFLRSTHIQECFSVVLHVLDRVVENGGMSRLKPLFKPFKITPNQIEKIDFSDNPITVSDLTRRINDATEPAKDSPLLRYSSVTYWLVEDGYLLIEKSPEGRSIKTPTARGEEVGLTLDPRTNSEGATYNVLAFTVAGQRFIAENVDAIVDSERKRFQNQRMPWSQDDDILVKDLYYSGTPFYEIALQVKRSSTSVREHCKKLGLMSRRDTYYPAVKDYYSWDYDDLFSEGNSKENNSVE